MYLDICYSCLLASTSQTSTWLSSSPIHGNDGRKRRGLVLLPSLLELLQVPFGTPHYLSFEHLMEGSYLPICLAIQMSLTNISLSAWSCTQQSNNSQLAKHTLSHHKHQCLHDSTRNSSPLHGKTSEATTKQGRPCKLINPQSSLIHLRRQLFCLNNHLLVNADIKVIMN